MRKRITFTIVTVCVLLITGCGASNNTEDPAEADSQIEVTYVENAGQTDTEENIATDDVADEDTDEDTDALSPLDGVTMEVTECSNTSVTVRIANDTDKDIQCGSDFCLEVRDEETGEWRELNEIIDNAAFTMEAYIIPKDSPYETVINFEWLYGKQEPGRYRVVKTVTDFRGTGDYTNYVFMAEFSIEEDSDIANAEELADTFGILISLPVNLNWISDREYYFYMQRVFLHIWNEKPLKNKRHCENQHSAMSIAVLLE